MLSRTSQRARRRKGTVLVLAVAALAAVSVALGVSVGARAAPAQGSNTVTIGALLDISKGWTSLGHASRVALALATTDANARLAANGSSTRVRLRIVDVRGDTKLVASSLRQLAAAGVRVVMGPEGSSEVAAARPVANSLGMTLVSQGSTASSLALPRDSVFRFVPDDQREGEAVVALLKRDGIDGIVPVWRNDTGNGGLATSVRRQFSGARRVVAAGITYAPTATSFGSTVARVHSAVVSLRNRGARHPAVYLAAFGEVRDLFRAASTDEILAGVRWYGSDGVVLDPKLAANRVAARFADSVGYPSPTLGLSPAAAKASAGLSARIAARLGHKPDAFALAGYDALRVAARAVDKADPTNATAFRSAFTRIANTYTGATGKVALNSAGDRSYGSFDFWSVCSSGSKYVWRNTSSYIASRPGVGHLVTRQSCS